MARFGLSKTSGVTFAGSVSQGVWNDVITNLVPQITTYNGGNVVRVPPGAEKWEGHIVSTTNNHLRIDLQGITEPTDKTTIQWIQGSTANPQDQQTARYANWQVQFGSQGANRAKFNAKSFADIQKFKGSIAGVKMALGFDLTVDDFRTAMQHSYNECVKTGNFFCVLNPTGPYTEAVQKAENEWVFSVDCDRKTKKGCKTAMTVYLGKMEPPFDNKNMVEIWLKNALPQTPCPHCDSKYALEFVGGTLSMKSPTKSKGEYNFDKVDYKLVLIKS